jgi:hypothetical protein
MTTDNRHSTDTDTDTSATTDIPTPPLYKGCLGVGASVTESYVIELRPIPGWHTSGILRLRHALKVLLRGFGLRAVRVRPAEKGKP